MIILIQTDFAFKKITNLCIDTFKDELKDKGYELIVIDFIKTKKSFLEIALQTMKKYSSDQIGFLFDDLYFNKINLISAKALKNLFITKNLDYIRLDGRPKGKKEIIVEVDGVFFGCSKKKKYQLSTVLGFFSKKLLLELKKANIETPWEIEYYNINEKRTLAPNRQIQKYDNLIVKGMLDPYYMSKYNIQYSYSSSVIKKIKKGINFLINKYL